MNIEKMRYRQQGHMKRRALPIFFLLLTTGFILIGCGEKAPQGNGEVKRQTISGVSIATLAPASIDEVYEAVGSVKADRTSYVSSRIMSTVNTLLVKEGDTVENEQLLLTLDDRDVVQKVKAAEAGYQEAIRALESVKQNRELTGITYERYRKMFEEKAISRQEVDQFETQKKVAGLEYERMQEMVKRAAAGLSEAKIYLDFTRVTSPVKGRVTEKKTEVGSMAVPGMPLLTVENTDAFHAEVTVDEGLSGKLKTGTSVLVSIEAINKQIPGKIKEIVPVIDPLSRSFIVKVSLTGAGLRSGLYTSVKIPSGKKEVLLVPQSAFVEKGQLTGVYAVDDQGIVTYRLVRTGKVYNGSREILSGLKPNDQIIVQGVEKARDGGIIVTGK
jgi:RND family efflux transporter MFP subunit